MKKITKADLPQVLKEKRGTLSMATFANRLKIKHRQTIAAWEAGEYLPDEETLQKLNISLVYEVRE